MSDITSVKPWLYWSLLPVHRTFLHLYFSSIVVVGREYLPDRGPLVIAAKHFSRWDPLVLSLLSTEPLRFMTNANQFAGPQGWMIERLGAFPVNLSRPSVSSLRRAIDLIHAGRKLVIFPEGGIVRDQPLRSFKPGLARLVLQAEATAPEKMEIPIVPIALRYEPDAKLRSKVTLHISPPLYTSQYQQEGGEQTAQLLSEAIYESMLKGLNPSP
jgi:1-acyl-sn-glycerol-3-phosphate acyltransferase